MSFYWIRPGDAPAEILVNGGVVTNNGPAPVYYSDTDDVSASVYEGSLSPGTSTTLDGAQWFAVNGARTSLTVIPGVISDGAQGPPGPAGPAGPAGQGAVAISDAVRGQSDRFYRLVAGAVRFDGTTWGLVNDSFSRAQNVDGVTVDHRKVKLDITSIGALHVGDFTANPGENLASVGIRSIVKKGLTAVEIRLQQDRRMADFAVWDGSVWVLEKGAASPFTLSGLDGTSTNYSATVLATANLQAYYRFSDATGAVLTDAHAAINGVIVGSPTRGLAGGVSTDGSDVAQRTTGVSPIEYTAALMGAMTQAAFTVEIICKVNTGATTIFRDNTVNVGTGYYIASSTKPVTSASRVSYRMGSLAATYTTTYDWNNLLDGQFHHFVVTKNGVNVALYIDGVLVHSAATGSAVALATPWHLGRDGSQSPGLYHDITFDEAAFYSRDLTAAEARDHYYAMSATGQLRVGHEDVGDANPSSVVLTPRGSAARPVIGSAATSVRSTGFDVEFYDSSNAIMLGATTGMEVGLERNVTERQIDPQALSVHTVVQAEDTYANTILVDAPFAHVRLGEPSGSTVADAIGDLDGTVASGCTLAATGLLAGDADTAALFDGAQGKIAFANPGITGAFSIEALFKCTGVGSVGGTIFSTILGWSTGGATRRMMYRNDNHSFQVEAGGAILTTPAESAALNTMHHVVYTWDTLSQRLYVDGALIVEGTSANITLSNPMWLGSYLGTSTNYSFKGTIDEFALYKTALSLNQIQQHWATAAGLTLIEDRSIGSTITFSGQFETLAPPATPVDPPPTQDLPTATPRPAADAGGGVTHYIGLESIRSVIGGSTQWHKRALPTTVGARNPVLLAAGGSAVGVPGWPQATSDNWRKSLCDIIGVDENSPGRDPVIVSSTLPTTTPLWLRPGEFMYVVPDDQPLRPFTDVDASVSGWAGEVNAIVNKLGGYPLPYDMRPHFTQDRYSFVIQPSTDRAFTIYDTQGTDKATTQIELTASPTSGGFFLKFFYLDNALLQVTEFFTQSFVPYNATATQVVSAIQGAKTTGNVAFGATRPGGYGPSVIGTGGPLNFAPVTLTFPLCEALQPVGMLVESTDNFMNAGGVFFTYHNAGPFNQGRLSSIVTPSLDAVIPAGVSTFPGGPFENRFDGAGFRYMDSRWMATATGIDFFFLTPSWEEYQTALMNGTGLGHVIPMSIGNCQGAPFNRVFPATRGDGTLTTADGSMIVEGARIAFPPDVDLSGVIPEFLPIARTIRDHGVMPIDKTGGGSEIILRRGGYPGTNIPSPWPALLPLYNSVGDAPARYMRSMPWHKAQIIDPSFSA